MFSHAPAQSRAQDERKRQSGREERNEGRGIRGEAVPMPGSSLEAQSQGSTSVVRENSPLRLPQEVFAASRSLLSFSVRAALFGWLTDDLLRTGGRPASIFRYHVGTSLFRVWTSPTVLSLSQEFSCHPRRSTPPR